MEDQGSKEDRDMHVQMQRQEDEQQPNQTEEDVSEGSVDVDQMAAELVDEDISASDTGEMSDGDQHEVPQIGLEDFTDAQDEAIIGDSENEN